MLKISVIKCLCLWQAGASPEAILWGQCLPPNKILAKRYKIQEKWHSQLIVSEFGLWDRTLDRTYSRCPTDH